MESELAIAFDGLINDAVSPLSDGPYWSPDGGYFWAKDGKYYWESGHVTDCEPLRLGFSSDLSHVEDFSAWSEEKRAAVYAETRREIERNKARERRYYKKRDALVESARAKLTEKEFDAVYEMGRDDGF